MERWSSVAVFTRPIVIFPFWATWMSSTFQTLFIYGPLYHYHPFQVWVPKRIMSIRFSEFSYISYVSSAPCPINLILREPIILILFDERVWLRNSHYGIFSCVLSFLCHRVYAFYSTPSSQGTSIDVLVQSDRPCFRNRKSSCTVISLSPHFNPQVSIQEKEIQKIVFCELLN
jgi:hypothetical protein